MPQPHRRNPSCIPLLLVGIVLTCSYLLQPRSAIAENHHEASKEKPPVLLPGLGNHSHPIQTRSPEAQRFFDQGLVLLYGFNRYESLRSFRRAAELDPIALMPHWGIAMALGPYVNMDLDGDLHMKESCKAVRDGMALRDHASKRERDYIEAIATRCPEYEPVSYRKAMYNLAQRYPDDFDAATFYAESLMIPVRWKWWNADGTPAEGMDEAVRVLESVLRHDPNHPGANHYYIHAVEMSPSPERAIPSAQRLMGLVPAAGHLVHMAGHVWLLLGDYDLVAEVNENAAERDREYMQATGVTNSSYAGYYIHNLHFIAYARQMQGQMLQAIRAANFMADEVSSFVQEMPMMVDAFSSAPLFALLRFQRWDQILFLKPPPSSLFASVALWHFGRAIARAAKDQRLEAIEEEKAFEIARQNVPKNWLWLNNPASRILDLASAVLKARLDANESASILQWKKAVALEDNLIYDEPPPWYYPIRESFGGALLRAGQAKQAEAVFREGLRRHPRDGRMLFGLIQSLEAQQKREAAEMVRREFNEAWKDADVSLDLTSL